MTQAGLLCSRSPRERHSNRANGTNYDHLMDRSANSPRRSKAFVNAVTWLDPRACGPNERMWRVKMAWVWVAPCLFVAFALPVLASGALIRAASSACAGCSCCSNGRAIRTAGCSPDEHGAFAGDGPFPISPGSNDVRAGCRCCCSWLVVLVLHLPRRSSRRSSRRAHAELTQSSRRAHAELTQSAALTQL